MGASRSLQENVLALFWLEKKWNRIENIVFQIVINEIVIF